jgi:signal transduction histidine kinase
MTAPSHAAPVAPATGAPRIEAASPRAARSASVLVVEDSATQAAALVALLEAAGHTVRAARSAEAALALLADRALVVDLVLSDVLMPGMSGYDFCRALKGDAARRELPVVLLTSLGDPLDIVRGLECGADHYVTKPFGAADLLARLDRVLETHALRRTAPPGAGIAVTFLGTRLTVTSSPAQILDLLVSSYEELVRSNAALRAAEAEREEALARERTARVEAETARVRAEEARVAAEEANQAKGEFLAMMSHDLRTPLNAIGGYTYLLRKGIRGPVTPEQVADLDRIRHNQAHLLALVNDVLNFARVERRDVPLVPAVVLLDGLLEAVHAVVGPQLAERELAYEYRPCEDGLAAWADRDRVEQVLVNLLANAIKFTPRGGRVTLECRGDATRVHISVTDTGIGIPPERHEEIFHPFVQVDARRTGTQEGVGLGLAISRNLARLMDGDLTVESAPGAGSVFTLTLPRPDVAP